MAAGLRDAEAAVLRYLESHHGIPAAHGRMILAKHPAVAAATATGGFSARLAGRLLLAADGRRE